MKSAPRDPKVALAAAPPCAHLRLFFDQTAGGLYLDCLDCPRRFVAGRKDTWDLPDYFARTEIHAGRAERREPLYMPPPPAPAVKTPPLTKRK